MDSLRPSKQGLKCVRRQVLDYKLPNMIYLRISSKISDKKLAVVANNIKDSSWGALPDGLSFLNDGRVSSHHWSRILLIGA